MSSPTPAVLRVRADDGATLSLQRSGEVVFRESRLVHVEIDRVRHERFDDPEVVITPGAVTVTGLLEGTGVLAVWSATRLGSGDVWELGLRLTNAGDVPVSITRMDPLAAHLDGGRWSTLWFRSAWGDEFRPERGTTDHHTRLESRSGRSSHGMSPWIGLERPGAGLVVTPAWSGNWHIDISENSRVSAGISTWLFSTELAPGQSVTAPSVVVAVGADREAAASTLTSAIGQHWIPRSPASERLDLEWNHWWPYEDAEVTEGVIAENAAIAAELGFATATVDAGWFGPSDATTYWGDHRGDWAQVNTERFPSGLGALGDSIRSHGLRAGIWVEAEALGSKADVRRTHPEIVALAVDGRRHDPSYDLQSQSLDPDDPTFLGYVCLGSEAGRAFVLESMSSTVTAMGAEWIKLDFNVDPDAGCTRTDHGHGAHDGLLRHYEGLYEVLDAFRERHPETVLEACSSGGLRIDLGLARHVHCFFLSDPDWTEHHLQVLWGARLLLPPAAILHWSWSQWRGDHPQNQLDFSALTRDEFDTLLRAAMLHRFGLSMRLPELSAEQRESVRTHTALFRETVAPFVRDGVLRALTAQPIRGGFGERVPAFQLSAGPRHVVAAFRLPGGTTPPRVPAIELDPRGDYVVSNLATGNPVTMSGEDLLWRGIPLDDSGGRLSSWMFLIEPATADSASDPAHSGTDSAKD